MFQSPFFIEFLALSEPLSALTLGLLGICFFIIKILENKKISFSIRMFVGLLLGIILGLGVQTIAGFPASDTIKSTLWIQQSISWYGLFGNAFVRFIRMLVIPIILMSMIRVILNLQNGINIKALVNHTLFWLLLTTAIAAVIGIVLSLISGLGSDMTMQEGNRTAREVTNIVNVLLGLIPSNPIETMVNENIVGVVIFASFIGSSAHIMASKEKYQAVMKVFIDFIESSYRIVMSMSMTIIKLMPYAVVALMACTLISNGLLAIKEALLFIILVYTASSIMIVIYMVIIFVHGLNPITFVKKSANSWLMAFSSRSSVGSLPMTISTLEEKLGVNTATANFVASLGSTVGMNGCAGYFPAMSAMFVARITGTPIDLNFMVMVIVVAILGSLGIAGIPGSATMATSIMLSGIGLNQYFELLAIVLAIDPIIDMARTLVNVAGTMTAAVSIDKELKTLNINVYDTINNKEYFH